MKEPKYPKGECVWVNYQNPAGELLYILTSKENNRDWYYLYQLTDGEFKKLGRAKTPPELEEKYGVIPAILSNAKSANNGKRRRKKE